MAKTHKTIVCIGSWCFVHAGITEALADKYLIKDINKIFNSWVLGKSDNRINELLYIWNSKKCSII